MDVNGNQRKLEQLYKTRVLQETKKGSIKGSIQQQYITFINIYASKTDNANIKRPKGETATQWNNGYKDMLDQMDITFTEYSIENRQNLDSLKCTWNSYNRSQVRPQNY